MVSFFTIPHANLALAESIILQTPAIAARTSESLEYSNDGELAILYELGDIEAFKDAWLELDSNYSNLQDRLKDRSYIIADKFNIDNNDIFAQFYTIRVSRISAFGDKPT